MTKEFDVDSNIFTITGEAPAHGVGLFGEFRLYNDATLTVEIASEYIITDVIFNNVFDNPQTGEVTIGDEVITLDKKTEFTGVLVNTFKVNNTASSQVKFDSIEITYQTSGPIITHSVSFDSNGGSKLSPVEVMEARKLDLPVNPYKENHAFVGWFTDMDLNDAYNKETLIYEDITLYAKWREIIPVSVSIYDGSDLREQITVEKGSLVSELSTEKEGFQFKGWYETASFNNEITSTTKINDDLVLYGLWEEVTFTLGEYYQGDAARIVMYMMLRLPNTITAQKAIAGDSYNLLAKWHYEDPVDAFEIRRNNILYEAQGNRKPFIDYPVFFDLIN